MSEGGMLYLVMTVLAFLMFCGTLMWAMIETSPRRGPKRAGGGVRRPILHHH
ncbi:MAG TPA: hypothetical protein VFF72_12070 [Caldimonas sp.]|nr:hypothetical protein [Caldimonas sp.]